MTQPLSSNKYHFKNDPDFKDCTQILPGIYAFPEFPTYDCVVYAVVNNRDQICLIDAGNGRSFDAILMAMEMRQLNSANITHILLTHVHPDHVLGVYRLREYCEQQHQAMPVIYGHSRVIDVLCRAEEREFHLEVFNMDASDFMIKIKPLQGITLNDGDVIPFDNFQFRVLATPGHSSSALCFFETNNQILFTGDTVLAGGSYGRYDHWFDTSLQELKNSIARLREIHPFHLLPGHGEIVIQKATDHINATWKNIASP